MEQNLGTKRTTSSASGKIAAKSQEVAEQWKDAVVDQANQVRDKALSAKEHTSERIRGVAMQLQNVSSTLRDEDPLAADLAARASRGVEGVARYVSSASAQSVVQDTERLARRQPALFFGGAFLLGLAAGRFLKSSTPRGPFQSSGSDEDRGGPQVNRQDRSSGFFPTERTAESNRRYQENYAVTFDSDSTERPSSTESVGPGEKSKKGSLP